MTLVKINSCKAFIVSLTIDIDFSLIHETQNYVNQKTNKIIKQSVFIRVLYEKKLLFGKAICYNENKSCSFVLLSKKSCLDLKTMDAF